MATTGQLKTTEVRSLTVLEARRPKSASGAEISVMGCWQGHAPSEGSRGESFLFLSVSGGLQISLTFGHIDPFLPLWSYHHPFCLSVSRLLILQRAQLYWISAHPHDLVLTRLHLPRPYFQIRSHSQLPGIRMCLLLTPLYWALECC